MIVLEIPGRDSITLGHLVLDVNGTIALDGHLIEGVSERINALKDLLEIHLITADTHGAQAEIDRELHIKSIRVKPGTEADQKKNYVAQLGSDEVVCIGNGANDAQMLQIAAIGIAVLGGEGLNKGAATTADVICANIIDALDLLKYPRRLIATLRT